MLLRSRAPLIDHRLIARAGELIRASVIVIITHLSVRHNGGGIALIMLGILSISLRLYESLRPSAQEPVAAF